MPTAGQGLGSSASDHCADLEERELGKAPGPSSFGAVQFSSQKDKGSGSFSAGEPKDLERFAPPMLGLSSMRIINAGKDLPGAQSNLPRGAALLPVVLSETLPVWES